MHLLVKGTCCIIRTKQHNRAPKQLRCTTLVNLLLQALRGRLRAARRDSSVPDKTLTTPLACAGDVRGCERPGLRQPPFSSTPSSWHITLSQLPRLARQELHRVLCQARHLLKEGLSGEPLARLPARRAQVLECGVPCAHVHNVAAIGAEAVVHIGRQARERQELPGRAARGSRLRGLGHAAHRAEVGGAPLPGSGGHALGLRGELRHPVRIQPDACRHRHKRSSAQVN